MSRDAEVRRVATLLSFRHTESGITAQDWEHAEAFVALYERRAGRYYEYDDEEAGAAYA